MSNNGTFGRQILASSPAGNADRLWADGGSEWIRLVLISAALCYIQHDVHDAVSSLARSARPCPDPSIGTQAACGAHASSRVLWAG